MPENNGLKADTSSNREADASANPRYQWPPARDPNLNYKNKTRNPVLSIITALPLIMLVVGLFFYYRGESQQTQKMPIFAESIERSGVFTGLSATQDRHYLWMDIDGVAKGVRIRAEQVQPLEALEVDNPVAVKMAPTVQASTTYWAWHVEQSGVVLLNTENSLR